MILKFRPEAYYFLYLLHWNILVRSFFNWSFLGAVLPAIPGLCCPACGPIGPWKSNKYTLFWSESLFCWVIGQLYIVLTGSMNRACWTWLPWSWKWPQEFPLHTPLFWRHKKKYEEKLWHDTLMGSSGELGSEGTENHGPVSANICASGLAFLLPYS